MASKAPNPQPDPNYLSPEECRERFGSFLAADPETFRYAFLIGRQSSLKSEWPVIVNTVYITRHGKSLRRSYSTE